MSAGIRPWCAQAGLRQGNISVSAQLLLLFRSVLRAWKKRLGFDADFWAVKLFLTVVAFSFFQPSALHFLCYQTFLCLLSEAPLKTLPQLFASLLIVNLHLSAEMPGANCFSWTAAHECTYNLSQVQSLKGSDAPLSCVISILHDVVEVYQTNHN